MRRSLQIIIAALIAGQFTVNTAKSQDSADVELMGRLGVSGKIVDKSEVASKLEDGSASNQFGGLSAIDYLGDDKFLLLADRGAADGAVSYPCRFHEVSLKVNSENKSIEFELLKTTMLVSKDGGSLVGSLTAHSADINSNKVSNWTALDPEGMRRLRSGGLVVSDEYGPRVLMFDETGRLEREFSIPEHFQLREPESGTHTMGTYPNRGLEGVAVTPTGDRIVAVIQSPLIQDAIVEGDKCLGLNCRWILYQANGGVDGEVVYQLDNLKTGVSEVLAIDETKFLVLERDSKDGKDAETKRVYLCDTSGASDVRQIASLPQLNLPSDVKPVSKRLLIDLLDDRFEIAGKKAPEKPEGIAWGEPLADGRRTLWVCCDNDFDPKRTTNFYCFAIDPSAL